MAAVNPVVLPIPPSVEPGVSLDTKQTPDFRGENTVPVEDLENMISKMEKEMYLQTVLEEIPIPEKEVKQENKDSASLSFESRSIYLDAEVLRARLNEQLAHLEKILQALMNYAPSIDNPLLQEIKELALLYQSFCEQVFLPICNHERPVLLQKFYGLLSDCADRLLQTHLPELTSFLKTYNIPAGKENLIFAVFHLITGKRGLETEIKNFQQNMRQNVAFSAAQEKAGVLYGRDGQRSASFQPVAFHEEQPNSKDFTVNSQRNRGTPEAFLVEVRGMSKKEIMQIFPKLEKAEVFIKYLNSGGNLFESPDFTAKNDEFLGFLMAETAIKTQIFSENEKLSAPVESSLKNAVQKLIDYHIQAGYARNTGYTRNMEYGRNAEYTRGTGNTKETGDARDAYRIYMHTMQLFQTSKNPKYSLEKGLKYALEQFFAKREDASTMLNSSYQKESGFFQSKESERSPQALLAENIRLLEKDWKRFLKTLERNGKYSLCEAFSNYSPWASALQPEPLKAEHSLIQFSVLKAITVAVVLGAVYLVFFR